MRAGGFTIQQALSSDAATIIKQAVTLARRRGHAQVTPLHVANTMLSSATGLLRSACLRSQSNSHPLQCKALELCFNVALNRLPTSSSSPMLGPNHASQHPSISNALVAAFKRAQAHQRRGSVENQQQPLLAVKIELEQLIISILDDPSVSRVMREAGFSSTQVKSNVEQVVSLELSSQTPPPSISSNTICTKQNNGDNRLYNQVKVRNEDVMCVIDSLLDKKWSRTDNIQLMISTSFPYLRFNVYRFDDSAVLGLISTSIRSALDCPLNYARNYLADLLPSCVNKVVYLDSDLVLVDDIAKLAATPFGDENEKKVLAAPEYCNANFTSYFTPTFWSNPSLSVTFADRNACYFNTGVMVIDLVTWREGEYTTKIIEWMELQKRMRIYELGSLPPFLLVFAGKIAPVDHRWNQHGLGGDNFQGLCRDLHPGPVSLLHWSGKGKPWVRLDGNRACPLDVLWAPYDLLQTPNVLES